MLNPKKNNTLLKFTAFSLLFFTVILLVCEIAVAVLNDAIADTQFGAYTMTLIVIPVISLMLTVTLVWAFYTISQKSQVLIKNLNKVASGDYGAQIEVRRGDTFAEVYLNFNKMTRELNSVKTLRDDFVHELSHEFKTPLASIHGFADLLLEGGVSEEERNKFLRIISDEADRLRRLADGILILSKLENQQMPGENEQFRLDVQINECIIMTERGWSQKNIDVSSSLDPVKINGDPVLLRQVWLNLLSNAVKFTPEGGKILCGLTQRDGYAVVTVSDNGTGIKDEDLPKIFDKYYRGTNLPQSEGNGLGLAVCKRICNLCGGEISVESRLGEGAAFTVKLPL